MESVWYYVINGAQTGPVSFAELKDAAATGKLSPPDLVWQEGTADWVPLPGTVRHGFTHFRLEVAVIAGSGKADGLWSGVDRLGEHALPTLMKKIARHAVSALA